ncbi:MAG TPA: Gfo/Idh/MocA family oxidoreductase, partial [Desulfobacterales bacterium]|nr:Gfo/Idh/MocA family oxidoreductase [Desulfobacterales bacterium]
PDHHGEAVSFKICLIGCGYIARASHAPAFVRYAAHRAGTELAACCDVDAGRAAAFRADFGFARDFTDHARMLDEVRPDVVCLAAPPSLAVTIGCDVLRRGIPLLIEKPPGTSVEEVDRLAEAADAGGVPARVAFNRRHSPLVRELAVQLSADGGPTAIRFIRFEMLRVDRRDPDFSLTAIHGIDLVCRIAGCDYGEISIRYLDLPRLGQGVANFHLSATMASGALASLEFLPVSGIALERVSVVLEGIAYCLGMPTDVDGGGYLRRFARGALEWQKTGPEIAGSIDADVLHGFAEEDTGFFDALRDGPCPAPDLRTARQPVAVAQCIRERRSRFVGGP